MVAMRRASVFVLCAALVACRAEQKNARPPVANVPPTTQEPTPREHQDASSLDAKTEARAPFVLAIEVDQLSAWVAASRLPLLPEDGGFARLRREGTWVQNLRFAHAVTDTAPGHASLHTGKTPREHGIFGNERPLPGSGSRRMSILRDDRVQVVAEEGVTTTPGASARALRAETVADRLRKARPDALVVSVSLKDRGAILPAGQHPSQVFWFDGQRDEFVTSTAFANALPAWLAPLGGKSAIQRLRASTWTLTDRDWTKAHAATPDDAPGEGNLDGFGTIFPHEARTSWSFRALPVSDTRIFDVALAAIAHEYRPSRPTLVLLSLSASDMVGHTFGPDSWEAWDHLRKLDRTLGDAITALEARVGPITVMLSADHGNVSMPEASAARSALPHCATTRDAPSDPWQRPCTAGFRLGPTELARKLQDATRKDFGRTDLVAGVADPYVFLTDEARSLDAARRTKLDRTIRRVLHGYDAAVAEIYDARTLTKACPEALADAAEGPARARETPNVLVLVCRSWAPDVGAGDYYVVTKPGSFWDGEVVAGKGASHGTPYLYDRTVPLLVRAQGDVQGGRVIDSPIDFSIFAALEAQFLGLDPRPANAILETYLAAQ